jgi:hypothetical protein
MRDGRAGNRPESCLDVLRLQRAWDESEVAVGLNDYHVGLWVVGNAVHLESKGPYHVNIPSATARAECWAARLA